jgi:hypothetical protein
MVNTKTLYVNWQLCRKYGDEVLALNHKSRYAYFVQKNWSLFERIRYWFGGLLLKYG